MSRQASNDWAAVLCRARILIERRGEPPSFPELWDQLVEEATVEDTPTQRNGFRAAYRVARLHGEVPRLPPGKRGPAPGTPWSAEREEAEMERRGAETAHLRLTRAPTSCTRYIAESLERHGRLELKPSTMAALREAGFGAHIVMWSLAVLQDRGVATFRRVGPVIVLTETADHQDELAAA